MEDKDKLQSVFIIVAFLIAFLIAVLILVFKFFIFSFIKTYDYHGVNPIFLQYGYPTLNIVTALLLLIIMSIAILLLIKIRSTILKKRDRILVEVLILFAISTSIGIIHSLIYFIDKDSYIIDDSVAEIQKHRIDNHYLSAINKNREKIVLSQNFIKLLQVEKPKIIYHQRLRSLYNTTDKWIAKAWLTDKKETFNVAIEIYTNVITVNINYDDGELKIWSTTGSQANSEQEKNIKDALTEMLDKKNYKGLISVTNQIIYNHSEIEKKMLTDKTEMINYGYASIDLFIYDTLLKSFGKDSGDYKPISFFSRSLTILHIAFIYMFLLIYGQKMLNIVVNQQTPKT